MTGDIVAFEANMQTWRNQSADLDDPIAGRVIINTYQPAQGISSLQLAGVTLQDSMSLSLCTFDGLVITRGFSMP